MPLDVVRAIGELALMLLAGATLCRTAVLEPGLRGLPPADALRLRDTAAPRLRRLGLAAGIVLLLTLALEPRDWTVVLRVGLTTLLLLRATPRVRLAQTAVTIWFATVLSLIIVVGGPPHVDSMHFLYVVLPSVVYGLIAGLGTLILPLVPDVRIPELSWAPAALAVCLSLAHALAPHAAGHGAVAAAGDAAHMVAGVMGIGGAAALIVALAGLEAGRRMTAARHLVPGTLGLAGIGFIVLMIGGAGAAPTLPTLNAGLNATSALLVAAAYRAIRRRQVGRHRRLMLTALGTSALFLTSYLYYHAQVGSVRFTGEGWVRPAYFGLLISHTVLAAAIVPLVAITLHRALSRRFALHRRIARYTLPVWLYVSVTGVVVYLMLYRLSPTR